MLGLTLALVLTFQTPTPEPRYTVLHLGTETSRTERDLRIEHRILTRQKTLTRGQHARLVAITSTLMTIPVRQRCITWEQHVAEVTSWWAAPEREYVDCGDPRVRPSN